MQMIKSKNLVFEYTQFSEEQNENIKHTALSNINLQIEPGEFVAILGHNGSGKSTLAKHMNALLRPSAGTIWIKGFDTKNDNDVWNVRQSAGMVFQNPDNQLIATIVEDDIAFGPENLGVEPQQIRKRVDDSLNSVGMGDYKKQSPHFLSGGQKQRIAIAGVLAMKPDCIVLDEPTAMLDPSGRREVMDTIMHLNSNENITVILITHYMDEAIKANRIIVMESGRIVMDDIPKKIFSRVEEMRRLKLDVPQVTELAHNLKKLGVNIPSGILTIDEMVGAILDVNRN